MDKVTVSIDKLSGELQSILNEYARKADASVESALKQIAGKARNAVGRNARATFKKYHGKRIYSNGWSVKRKIRRKLQSYQFIVYNKTAPGLAHLLEKGHASRNGGRVPAYPHIKPVEDEVVKAITNDVINELMKIKMNH